MFCSCEKELTTSKFDSKYRTLVLKADIHLYSFRSNSTPGQFFTPPCNICWSDAKMLQTLSDRITIQRLLEPLKLKLVGGRVTTYDVIYVNLLSRDSSRRWHRKVDQLSTRNLGRRLKT